MEVKTAIKEQTCNKNVCTMTTNNDSDMYDNDLSQYNNLDPTVVALLGPVVTASSSSSSASSNNNNNNKNNNNNNNNNLNDDSLTINIVRTRIAMIKLEQSRIRGNSNYAAKIMDQAIEEGARDRQAWILLDNYIKKLDKQVIELTVSEQQQQQQQQQKISSDTTLIDNDTKYNSVNNNDHNGNQNNKNDDSVQQDNNMTNDTNITREELKQLQQQLDEEQERSSNLTDLLHKSLEDELRSILIEQATIKDREKCLKNRIRTIELIISKQLPPLTTNRSSNYSNATTAINTTTTATTETTEEEEETTTTKMTTTVDDINKKQIQQQQQQQQHQQQHEKQLVLLQDLLKDIHSNQCMLVQNTLCSICHEQDATKAVIPCGHLCMCDQCTKTIVSSVDAIQRQCPLCRGNLLSTLHIYTSK